MPDLTERTITTHVRREAPFRLADHRIPGLVVRRQTATGAVVFHVQLRIAGRHQRITLGRWPALTLSEARKAAQKVHGERAQGLDPMEIRRAPRGEPTVREIVDALVDDPALAKRTVDAYRSWAAKYILPAFGSRRVGAVTRDEVRRWHARVGREHGEVTANRSLNTLRRAYNLAELEPNPARGVRAFTERGRTRFLTPDEWRRLLEELRGRDDPASRCLFLVAQTGCRNGEARTLRWAAVDFSHGLLHVTGKTGPRVVPMTPDLRQALLRWQVAARSGEVWVFPSPQKRGAPISRLQDRWVEVREAAGIEGARVHDLRHSVAERMIRAGASLRVAGEVLGHTQAATTQRYAHVARSVAAEALERGLEGVQLDEEAQ